MLPTCDRCGHAHPNYGRGANLGPEDNALTALPWRIGRGKPGRSDRVRMYVKAHPGASAVEVIRALGLSLNPYGRSYSEPVWHALGAGVVYDAAVGRAGQYRLHATDLELRAMVEAAQSTDDYKAREALIDSLGPLIRSQIASA